MNLKREIKIQIPKHSCTQWETRASRTPTRQMRLIRSITENQLCKNMTPKER